MKIKLLIAIFAFVALTASVSAQDTGTPDSVIVNFTHTPDVASGDSLVSIEVIFWVDENIRSAAAGMGWDFDGFVMDSAAWTPAGESALNLFRFTWSQNNLDSTNFHKRFQCTGFGTTGLATWAVVANFHGHVTQWAGDDAINISTNPFVSMNFVDANNNEFPANWSGDRTIADVNAINLGTLPTKFDLSQNYPNPFNPSTVIRFDLPRKAHTTLTIFNVLGQRVATLVDEDLAPGFYDKEWKGTTDAGNQVASGIYFYRLNTDQNVMTKKMLLLK